MDTHNTSSVSAGAARRLRAEQATKHDEDEKNPCLKEQKMTYKCLADNNYDREKCAAMFANYKNCKEFWYKVSKDRRINGIYPYLPELVNREKVKEDYLRKWGGM